MDEFRMIATVLSLVLGLGVTRLLLGLVGVFRARGQSPVDWIPIAWAGCLFLEQLQYWWAINFLPTIRGDFSFLDFVFLVILTMMLFLASALLLPSRPEDEEAGLRVYFEQDGRYGVLALAAFGALALVVNVFFFNASPLSAWGALDVPMIAIPLAAFLVRSRRAQALLVLAYVPLSLVDMWVVLGS
jgi:hypothetical protein